MLAALAEMRGWLSTGLASAINIFHPKSVVLSGYLAPLSAWIGDDLETDLADRVYGSRWRSCEVLASDLGALIASRGAVTPGDPARPGAREGVRAPATAGVPGAGGEAQVTLSAD